MTEQEVEGLRTLKEIVGAIRMGEAFGHRNLTLVPLRGEGHRQLDYLLAMEAIQAGTLTVTEVSDAGSVPELLAINASDRMVLLLDGEELVGAKQNRILNTTILLRPNSKTKVPVSCVEQGRWRHTSLDFAPGNYSPSKLRARKSRDVTRSLKERGRAEGDQGAVWDEVHAESVLFQAPSPTMAMSDIVEQRRESFDEYVKALPYPADACGVVAAVNGRLLAVDAFDKPQTLERIWPRLITGYAMDALSRVDERSVPFTTQAAEVLLEHVGEIGCDILPNVGVGRDWRFTADDIVGQALMAKRVCVHLSVFPNDDGRNDHRSFGSRILPPSQRRRR